MASTARPVRNRNQPSRNKDNIELNMQLIQRLEANKGAKSNNSSNPNYPKLLATFVNSVNQNYRAFLSKKQKQKKEQSVTKPKPVQAPDNQDWKAEKQKKKTNVNSISKTSLKTGQSFIAQQPVPMEKNNNQQTKNLRVSKNPSGLQSTNSQQIGKNQQKQVKRVVVLTPPPVANYSQNKPFKRSSYHIGIAYTIYMDQLKQKNPNTVIDINKCDPTIHARKLKMSQMEN